MKFYLGTHMPNWLYDGRIPEDVSLFISRQRLVDRCKRPKKKALCDWAMDSGGFTQLSQHSEWTFSPCQYVRDVRFYMERLGRMDWAAPMDWMCEPWIVEKTGLTVEKHQMLTVLNFLELRELADDLPFVPVLQGWKRDDYLRCWEMYDRFGVDLEAFDTVGLGSVCRRQSMGEAADIVRSLQPLKLHGFGFKLEGLRNVGHILTSADSMAWSYGGRLKKGESANSSDTALKWLAKIFDVQPQMTLADMMGW